MKYNIDALDLFSPYDEMVIYYKNRMWHGVTYTDGYRLLKRDRKMLVDEICKTHKVKASDVKFVSLKSLIGED